MSDRGPEPSDDFSGWTLRDVLNVAVSRFAPEDKVWVYAPSGYRPHGKYFTMRERTRRARIYARRFRMLTFEARAIPGR